MTSLSSVQKEIMWQAVTSAMPKIDINNKPENIQNGAGSLLVKSRSPISVNFKKSSGKGNNGKAESVKHLIDSMSKMAFSVFFSPSRNSFGQAFSALVHKSIPRPMEDNLSKNINNQ